MTVSSISGAVAPRIGPNAVGQSLRAIEAQWSRALARRLAAEAGVPAPVPNTMVPEAWFVQLVSALRAALGAKAAAQVLRQSGEWTADYVSANRIPAKFRAVLRWLPRRWSVPLLLFAFQRHAWTFAGASRFRVERSSDEADYILILDNSPTCRGVDHSPAEPSAAGGAYYEAAFEGLLRLAGPSIRVREVSCRLRGDDVCRFTVNINDKDQS